MAKFGTRWYLAKWLFKIALPVIRALQVLDSVEEILVLALALNIMHKLIKTKYLVYNVARDVVQPIVS